MTRTNAREIAIHFVFELGFSTASAEELLDAFFNREFFARLGEDESLYSEFPNEKQQKYITELVTGTAMHGAELDGYIEKYAIGWKLSRIGRVAAAVMRVAMYEILYMPDIDSAVSINEALEIAKGYEDPEVISFINGVLGSFVRSELPEERRPAAAEERS